MKTTTIRQGTHAPFRIPKLITKDVELWYDITFKADCSYDIDSDQSDINKLFGVGYYTTKIFKTKEIEAFGEYFSVPWPRAMHHYNSVRFGWRYDHSVGMMEILSYWYDRGVRNNAHMAWVKLDTPYRYSIQRSKSKHTLAIYEKNGNNYELRRSSIVGVSGQGKPFPLYPFFGGNRPAPHDMTIEIKKAH